MLRRTPLAVTLAGIALGLAACAGGTETADTAETPASATSPASDGQVASDEIALQIDDFAFDPETTTVEAGATVTWTNEDATAHTVTAGTEDRPDPDAFDLHVDEQGQAVSSTFDEPGTHLYFCEVHPFMTGTVEVTG